MYIVYLYMTKEKSTKHTFFFWIPFSNSSRMPAGTYHLSSRTCYCRRLALQKLKLIVIFHASSLMLASFKRTDWLHLNVPQYALRLLFKIFRNHETYPLEISSKTRGMARVKSRDIVLTGCTAEKSPHK